MESTKTTSGHTVTPTRSFVLASIAALAIGAGAYVLGLFNAAMALNEKGYYLIILLYGLFSMVSLQKSVRDQKEGIATSAIYVNLCWLSSAIAIALLVIGLYNAELMLSEKGFYAMAYTLSLFAAVVVQKNTRDSKAADENIDISDEVIQSEAAQ
ncbi:inner membrane protein YiaA [Thalassomonas actiniarum]|uniref:YiaAB two helix domain-containing protein n=1 Tax=Thalassomonas actiniarum TaxID=485447 RepID=A0AAF0C3Z3_9GAMM|nr:inner membrane protein YiaA [Thalassomonas actiniarum]WDD99383.1 hypothetical protein SG35_001450 [Thalassomonas actiniarum]